ncbi:Microspherule protein N-terminal domain-containing protein [Dioscorea alata]|uniref:Microspherule protein N-terminal domain-containing protein n=2 Tax=Dioscorea alata TaxID=55571 RepID=A0ACB7VFS0_DIOAL|nr:Microspherule protein N-terminal domain-containing protein [Dioscorea alata]
MGALAPLANWIPEDDLLLKNAVEAGASLESLAKGAVRFSRRYTIKELQDRWRSLLYDSDTAQEASARIIEIEIELSVSNAPKANRISCLRGKEHPGKRKGDSVRSHYHALRKRVCSEPHSSADLGFLVRPTSHFPGNITEFQQNLNSHSAHIVNSDAIAISSKVQEPFINNHQHLGVGASHILPDLPMADSAVANDNIAADVFHTRHMNDVSDSFPVEMAANDCIFPVMMPSVDQPEADNAKQPFQHDFIQNDVPHTVKEELGSSVICQDVQEVGQPETLQMNNTYENDGIKTENVHAFDSTLSDHHCCGFDGSDSLISQIPECSDSLHQLGYSSPEPGVPSMWRTMNDISMPTFAIDRHFEDNQGAEALLDFDNIEEMHSPGCHGAMSEAELNERISDGALKSSKTVVDSEYMDISSSYMNFTDDWENPCFNSLNSILLNSPSDSNQHPENACGSTELGAIGTVGACPVSPSFACLEKSSDLHEQKNVDHDGNDSVCISGMNDSCMTSKASHNTESHECFMACVLNTEDPEIPCNDHIFVPDQLLPQSPDFEYNPIEKSASVSPSNKALDSGKADVQPISQPFISSFKTELPMLSSVGHRHSSDGCRLEAEAIGSGSRIGVAFGDPNSCTSINVSLQSGAMSASKEESVGLNLGKHDGDFTSFGKMPIQSSDLAKLYPSNISDICKQETEVQVEMQGHMVYQPQSSGEMLDKDPEKIKSELDQEDHLSDSENDLPNFSDIEAMILDMDLGPYDQEPYLFTKAVSRYQCMDTKKAIIRLEQGAHSYMHRAISRHGAFAVFYGRHLKYYIKSPKVSLGRATEGVKVDIDLGREGHTKKISRRQAIIKLEQDGLFFMINVGKGSIFINSKEVPSGKRINLISGCLIEIRGMRFIFEMNQSATSQYLRNSQGSKKEQDTKFEWLPGQAS